MKTFSYILVFFIGLISACNAQSNTPDFSKADKNFKKQLNQTLENYYQVKDALVASNPTNSAQKAQDLLKTLQSLDKSKLTAEQSKFADNHLQKMLANSKQIVDNQDIEKQRQEFEPLSLHLQSLLKAFRPNDAIAYWQFCPMAFQDKGAGWLSNKKQIANPYFGNKMLRCGRVKEEI